MPQATTASTIGCMVEIVVIALLLVVLVYLLAQNGRLRDYKGTHLYTKSDVDDARKRSVSGSRAVTGGKVQEHIAPLLPEFADRFEFADARFMGAPIDYIIFSGISEGRVDKIVFLDVKTGQASLNKRQRLIREAVEEGRVEFETLKLKGISRVDEDEIVTPDDKVEWMGSWDIVNGQLVKISND